MSVTLFFLANLPAIDTDDQVSVSFLLQTKWEILPIVRSDDLVSGTVVGPHTTGGWWNPSGRRTRYGRSPHCTTARSTITGSGDAFVEFKTRGEALDMYGGWVSEEELLHFTCSACQVDCLLNMQKNCFHLP